MKRLIYILSLLACLASCSDDFSLLGDDGEIQAGENVAFTTSVPKPVVMTRALNAELLKGYKTIADDYELTIRMLKGNDVQVGSEALYQPLKTEEDGVEEYDAEGTLMLKQGASPLLWESSTVEYAFEATAGTDVIASDQSTRTKWLAQDRLHGYAFSPFEPENGEPADRIDAPNYHTSKAWYQLNKAWHDAEGQMMASEDYKKIPLFLQHDRAWITVILKAGKGVRREAVAALYNAEDKTYNPNASVAFYNYPGGGGDPGLIEEPLKGSARVHYDEDVNGGAADSLNLRFDAIVGPHNFMENPTDDKIAAIDLSGLRFSFYASNDKRYASATPASIEAMEQAYNLTAGKHLTIEATLSTDRIVFITAWIEDWTEVVTSTICDDYGQNGDPTVIKSRQELLDFLNDAELNRAGNVAIIAATELNLDELVTPGATDKDPSTITPDPWTNYNSDLELNANLNLAGATLKTSGRLVKSISSTGNLVHGTVVMQNTTPLPSAIAEVNDGTIDHIAVLVGNNTAAATRAGLVETNYGYIVNSTSSLPVRAGNESSETYVGGIAARSIARDGTSMPTIDHCTMYAAVKGGTNVKGGGIVGLAEGRLTNNVFDYGMTLLQSVENFKNIIHTKDTSGALNTLSVGGNSWPTIAENALAGSNESEAKYHNVLDCEEELAVLLTDTYNKIECRYRVADGFTVLADTWNYAQATEDISSTSGYCSGNLYCELDGNGKTITLDSKTAVTQIPETYDAEGRGATFNSIPTAHMLFSNITGYVHDMTISVKKPVVAIPGINGDGKYNATDAIAAFAYAVRQPESVGALTGTYGVISNVNVKMADDSYVQGATAAGLVCWVHHGGIVDNCNVKGTVLSWTPNNGNINTDATRYVGGVVACAADATIKGCSYSANGMRTLDIAGGSGKMTTFYGGILGGTAVMDISSVFEYPQVSIVDCASWYQTTFTGADAESAKRLHGAILGYSCYTKDSSKLVGTVTEGDGACQGNWWQADMDGVALGGRLNGYTVETTIGKRNAVMPTPPNF